MFISFLYPFRLKHRVAPYLWVGYKQMGDLGADEIAFIASDSYFDDPRTYRESGRFECQCPENPELAFRVPKAAEFADFERYDTPISIYERLKNKYLSDTLVWIQLMTATDAELVEFLCHCIENIRAKREPEALLTWCNIPSVNAAARRFDLPVIHCELGPLRDPWYKPLGYFDFQGVNGNTEAAERYRMWIAEGVVDTPLSPGELRELFRGPAMGRSGAETEFRLGVALQVDDDSNVVAYGNGFNLYSMLEYAREHFRDREILVRPHPAGNIRSGLGEMQLDSSGTSWEFVHKCEKVLTLNSSVAVEAMLAGVEVTMLGESPARFAAAHSISRPRATKDSELDFLLLNYFVPYGLIFDRGYILWRLAGPTEQEIRARHLGALT